MKENDVLVKYNIHSRADLFRALSDQSIPAQDMLELERIYQEQEAE